MNDVVTLISNIGFPIVCCLILFSLYNRTISDIQNTIKRNTDIITYKMSSGFEALIGYLYLNKKMGRLDEIMNYILGGIYEKENN